MKLRDLSLLILMLHLASPAFSALDDEDAGDIPQRAKVERVVKAGARARLWLESVRAKLSAADFPPQTRAGVPTLQDPIRYNSEIILARADEILSPMPADCREVISGEGAVPAELPRSMPPEQFAKSARLLADQGDIAARWMESYPLRAAKSAGVLEHNAFELQAELPLHRQRIAEFDRLNETLRQQTFDWLWKGCFLLSACEIGSEAANLSAERAQDAFRRIERQAEAAHQSYFRIESAFAGARVKTTGRETTIVIPVAGASAAFVEKLNDAIAEWDMPGALRVRAELATDLAPRVEVVFERSQVPFVRPTENGFILSLPRSFVSDPDGIAKGLMREILIHEFGHVLGFPDCYIEFWDERIQGFTYYSLDPDDFMCGVSESISEARKLNLLNAYGR